MVSKKRDHRYDYEKCISIYYPSPYSAIKNILCRLFCIPVTEVIKKKSDSLQACFSPRTRQSKQKQSRMKYNSRTGFTSLECNPKKDAAGKKCVNDQERFFLNSAKSKRSLTGFTLLEMILVISIIAIIAVSGERFVDFAVDAQKYLDTKDRMMTIKRAIVGDERLHTFGMRADLGYFENQFSYPVPDAGNVVPTGGTGIRDYLPLHTMTTNYHPYEEDAWGRNFIYHDDVPMPFMLDGDGLIRDGVRILCYGRDGIDDTVTAPANILDADIYLYIRRDLYLENLIQMNVMDANGTILRGPMDPFDHQILIVIFCDFLFNIRFSTGSNNFFYYQGVFTTYDERPPQRETPACAGIYRTLIVPTFGTGSHQGIFDHQDDLNVASQIVVIYPKDPEVPNFLEIRMPGVVDIQEL